MLKLEHIMVLNNVTKFHRIIIKTIHVREQTSFQPMINNSLKHGAIQTIIKHEEDIMVLNNVTKFYKILTKTIQLREGTSFKTVNLHKQRAITAESMVGYDPLLNLKKTSQY